MNMAFRQKRIIIGYLFLFVMISLYILGTSSVVEAAFLIMAFYMFLITLWFNDADNRLDWKTSTKALLLGGAVAICLSMLIYPIWNIFANDGHPLMKLLTEVDADAGLIEEPAKLFAVLLIPSVRKSITDSKTGVFMVSLCALGFSMIEDIFYFKGAGHVLLIRANPAHAVFSAIWGKALGNLFAKKIIMRDFLESFMIGMGWHMAWNWCANLNPFIFVILFIFLSWSGLNFIRQELRQ